MHVHANQDLVTQPGEMEGWNLPHNRRASFHNLHRRGPTEQMRIRTGPLSSSKVTAGSCFGEVGCLLFLQFSVTEVGVALAIYNIVLMMYR